MQITIVDNKATERAFLELPVSIYKNDPNWIRPLDKDIQAVFDETKNRKFRQGKAIRWILSREGKVIGRIAAFIDPKNSFKSNIPAGGTGFFECINDQKAAFLLFDTAKAWLEKEGMEAMDGPINFGERDAWWGLLVDGFTPPSYRMMYHPPYYQELFEAYGFQVYFKQFTYARPVSKLLDKKYQIKADEVLSDPNYRFENVVDKTDVQIAEDFLAVYNGAWGNAHKGFKSMNIKQAKAIFKMLKPIMDKRIIFFGYYQNEPVSMFINLPEINQIVRHMNGKMHWWNKLRFWWHLKTGTCTKGFGFVFGVVPEHQGKGVEGAIVIVAQEVSSKLRTWRSKYTDFELTWIGDFNPKMMHVAVRVGGEITKTHITYRKLFDENRVFERAAAI